MKAPAFAYEKPDSLDAALRLLADAGEDAKPIAGGQSLGPLLNFRLTRPSLLVDVRGLVEMSAVGDSHDHLTLGAGTTHAAIEDGRVPDPANGMLRHVAHGIAYRAIRNRGTLGGSLAHADPAADWLSVMTVLDAEVLTATAAGPGVHAAAHFAQGPLATVLEPGELVVAIRIPKLSTRARWSYFKVNRKPGEFAHAIAAVVHDPERDVCRAVVGATGDAPYLIEDARPLLRGFDPRWAADHVSAAGLDAGSHAHRVHVAALRRAGAQIGGVQ
ncbi:MAG: carbon monoxide dehydrogenase [Betaproteobacteria bacterium]|nr:carbon monoxide dehydrogenase [Betaproteobacteria bacterium]